MEKLISLMICLILVITFAMAQTEPVPSDCYKGPPSSAKQCKPSDLQKMQDGEAMPVMGPRSRTIYQRYGDQERSITCREEQLKLIDERGCYRYCRIKEKCDAT